VAFYLGLHFESEKRHPNFRKTRSPIVENPAWVKNGYLRTGSNLFQASSGRNTGSTSQIPVPEWQVEEVERIRIKAEQNPESLETWDSVKEWIVKNHG
jgi:hypothetical protein